MPPVPTGHNDTTSSRSGSKPPIPIPIGGLSQPHSPTPPSSSPANHFSTSVGKSRRLSNASTTASAAAPPTRRRPSVTSRRSSSKPRQPTPHDDGQHNHHPYSASVPAKAFSRANVNGLANNPAAMMHQNLMLLSLSASADGDGSNDLSGVAGEEMEDDDDAESVGRSEGGTVTKKVKGGKKDKGTTFQCEKCSKVYRHPQCLVKHRWEHTAYWKEASKLMLSKHQQVQMLEAAAILASPPQSLPEEKSLWPAAVSPPSSGLLGSDQLNIEVIKRGSYTRSSSVLSSRVSEDDDDNHIDEDEEILDLDEMDHDDNGMDLDSEDVFKIEDVDGFGGGGSGNTSSEERDSGYGSGSIRGKSAGGRNHQPGQASSNDHQNIALSVSAPLMGYFEDRNPTLGYQSFQRYGTVLRGMDS